MRENCRSCGAAYGGLVCEYCGTVTGDLKDSASEKQALNEFHDLMLDFELEQRRELLLNGWLPDTRDALIEAGLRCVPIMSISNSDDWGDDIDEIGIARLRTVISKLKLMQQEASTQRAIAEFESRIREVEGKNRRDIIIGLGCIAFLLLSVLCASGFLLGMFGAGAAITL